MYLPDQIVVGKVAPIHGCSIREDLDGSFDAGKVVHISFDLKVLTLFLCRGEDADKNLSRPRLATSV